MKRLSPVGSVCLAYWLFCLLQLDQLVVDAAKEKRDMEQKHSTIQQKVQTHSKSGVIYLFILFPQFCTKMFAALAHENNLQSTEHHI